MITSHQYKRLIYFVEVVSSCLLIFMIGGISISNGQ
jgi:hypothetical protein